jgi:hypothetical protein
MQGQTGWIGWQFRKICWKLHCFLLVCCFFAIRFEAKLQHLFCITRYCYDDGDVFLSINVAILLLQTAFPLCLFLTYALISSFPLLKLRLTRFLTINLALSMFEFHFKFDFVHYLIFSDSNWIRRSYWENEIDDGSPHFFPSRWRWIFSWISKYPWVFISE